MKQDHDVPVLVVGAGPVGLAMVLELGWRGIACRLIDEGDGHIEHPRTGLVAVRTMEAFRRWGIAEEVRQCGFPEDYRLSMVFCTGLNGLLLDREDYPSMADAPTPPETPEKKQRCPQLWLHPILQRAVERTAPATLSYNKRLIDFTQDIDGVDAVVEDQLTGQVDTIRCHYLVGCDGGGSDIRKRLRIDAPGRSLGYSVNFMINAPALTAQHIMGEAERYLFVGPEGTWANLTVVDGRDQWRLTLLGSEEKLDLTKLDPEAVVRRALGRDDISFTIGSVLPWRRSETLADAFGDGRVWLAGDSVHTMSPTGGMGMNTGMQDVLDLGWKLEAMLAGWGGKTLLDSYTLERRPVAARNISFSSQNFAAWLDTPDPAAVCDETPEGVRVRAALGQRLRETTRVEWESLGLQIGYRYDASPICIPDGTPTPADDFSVYLPTARPGARAPHVWLKDGRSTLDLFGRTFVLLRLGDTPMNSQRIEAAFAVRNIPLKIVDLNEPEVTKLYARPLVLVRPDGHVAWRGKDDIDASAIADIVRGSTLQEDEPG